MGKSKTYWMLEIRGVGGTSFYIGYHPKGFTVVKDWQEGNRFTIKKHAEKHLIDLRAINPGLQNILGTVEINEHGSL